VNRARPSKWTLPLLLVASPCWAQDEGDPAPEPTETTAQPEPDDDKDKWCKDRWEGPEAWGCKRGIAPSGGIGALFGQDKAPFLHAGGSVSMFRWQRDGLLSAKVIASGRFLRDFPRQGDGNGYEISLAGYGGVRTTMFGLGIGLEIWRSRYDIASLVLEPTTGLNFPIFLEVGFEFLHLIGGFTPSYVFNPSRRVDWDLHPLRGFSHALSWYAGFETTVRLFSLALAYEQRNINTGDMIHSVTFGVKF